MAAADFNNDGKADLIFQHQTDRTLAVWYMNGSTFVDSERASAATIRENLAKARLSGGTVAGAPVEAWIKSRLPTPAYDLIFADPPYAKARGDRDWNSLLLGDAHLPELLREGGLFILESFAKGGQTVPPGAPWQQQDERRYGDSLLGFYQLLSHDAAAPGPAGL